MLARETDISMLVNGEEWFSCGRFSDLVSEETGYWLCLAVPKDDDMNMEMRIVTIMDLEEITLAFHALDIQNNTRIINAFMYLSGRDLAAEGE